MKCLFLTPSRYSVSASLQQGLEANGVESLAVDYEEFFPGSVNSFVQKFESLPLRVRDLWKQPYTSKVNARYKAIFDKLKPDIVLIYNNQLVQPWLLEEFRKSAAIVFILGDHPLYTPTNVYGLQLLFHADYIISPDSFWTAQLAMMGVPNIVTDSFSSDRDTYFHFEPTPEDYAGQGAEIGYIGTAHKNSWGYKRFLFLSQFSRFVLKAYMSGEGYTGRWKKYFPELSNQIIPHHSFDSRFNNKVYNCSTICPVDLVPSLFNGVHLRMWDILGSGSFPLCEYSKDLEEVFRGIEVPLIKDYGKAADLAGYLLKNDGERKGLVSEMRERAFSLYSPELVTARMLKHIRKLS